MINIFFTKYSNFPNTGKGTHQRRDYESNFFGKHLQLDVDHSKELSLFSYLYIIFTFHLKSFVHYSIYTKTIKNFWILF